MKKRHLPEQPAAVFNDENAGFFMKG